MQPNPCSRLDAACSHLTVASGGADLHSPQQTCIRLATAFPLAAAAPPQSHALRGTLASAPPATTQQLRVVRPYTKPAVASAPQHVHPQPDMSRSSLAFALPPHATHLPLLACRRTSPAVQLHTSGGTALRVAIVGPSRPAGPGTSKKRFLSLIKILLFWEQCLQAIIFNFCCCDAYRHCSCCSLAGIAGGMHITTSGKRVPAGLLAAYTCVIMQRSVLQYQGQMVSFPAFALCLPHTHLFYFLASPLLAPLPICLCPFFFLFHSFSQSFMLVITSHRREYKFVSASHFSVIRLDLRPCDASLFCPLLSFLALHLVHPLILSRC